jgi:hypothetical protein
MMFRKLGFLTVSIRKWQQDDIKLNHATWQAFPGLIPAFSISPGGNEPNSQLTEHRGIASAACPHAALSALGLGYIKEQLFIHSFNDLVTRISILI